MGSTITYVAVREALKWWLGEARFEVIQGTKGTNLKEQESILKRLKLCRPMMKFDLNIQIILKGIYYKILRICWWSTR